MRQITEAKQAVIYTRVSTRNQEDNTSLASQLRACKDFAAKHNLTVLDYFSDVYSGADLYDRKGLNAARELIRARRVQAFIVHDNDRLARKFAHLAILAEECSRHDVELHFVIAPLDQSPEGQLLRYIKGYVAEIEREKIKERTQRGIRQKIESGQFVRMGGDVYGYRFDKEKNQREIYEPEAEIVRDIFDWYLREKLSVNSIAKRLNERSVLTPQASKGKGMIAKGWYGTTVNIILRREEYSGKTFAGKFKLQIKRNARGSNYYHKSRQEPRYAMADSITPVIIPRDKWEQVQHRLDTNDGAGTRNAKRLVLLRGMVVCEKCKKKLLQTRCNFKPYYRCENSNPFPTGRCRISVRAEKLEADVWQIIADLFSDKEALARGLVESPHSIQDRQADEIERLRKDLQKLETAKGRFLRLLQVTDDESLADSIHEQLQQQQQQRARLEAELRQAEKQVSVDARAKKIAPDPLSLADQLSALMAMLEEQDKRKLLDVLQPRIILHPDKTWTASMTLSADSWKLLALPELDTMTITRGRLRMQMEANRNTSSQAGQLLDFFREALQKASLTMLSTPSESSPKLARRDVHAPRLSSKLAMTASIAGNSDGRAIIVE